MDLGIRGKTALVCAASKGLGKGCATSLAREGVNLVITARGTEALEATAVELKKFGVSVKTVAGDITTPEGREAALKACPSPDPTGAPFAPGSTSLAPSTEGPRLLHVRRRVDDCYRYCMGSTGVPRTRTSKWRWGPVHSPVHPT